jgi:hypothetical protein
LVIEGNSPEKIEVIGLKKKSKKKKEVAEN